MFLLREDWIRQTKLSTDVLMISTIGRD